MTMATIREPERVTVTVAQGPPGPMGPVGPAGPAGDVGPAGPTGTVAAAGDGTATAPGISFASDTNVGLYRPAPDTLSLSAGGAGMLHLTPNVVDQRNGTTAQRLRIFNTYTDDSNYERLTLAWASNTIYIFTESLGTGLARDLAIGSGLAGNLIFRTNSVNRWQVNGNTGHLLALTDNLYDIGASGANRPRSIYVGTSVVTPVLYGPSNVVEMRNGTTAQTLRIYGTYTDASNYARAFVGWSGTYFWVQTEAAGTGGPVNLRLNAGTHLEFWNNGISRWYLPSGSGHLYASSENTVDIGASVSNRPRNIYQSGGTFQSYNPGAAVANDGTNYERGELAWASNAFWLRTQAGGTGVARSVLVTSGALIQFRPGGLGSGWRFEPTGHLIAETDNVYDLGGGGGVNRPRNVYVGSTVQAASYVAAGAGTAFLAGEANAGNVILAKAAAALVSPGADKGKLYFRDGTTAGTLKLVVRAGAAGAETTVFDNIPQS